MSNVFLKKYGIQCETEGTLVYTWTTSGITQCPNNASHTVSGDSQIFDKSLAINVTSAMSPYIYNNKSVIADTTSGNITVNLLRASKQANKIVIVKKIASGNTLIIQPYSGDNINGNSNGYSMTTLNSQAFFQSDGISQWKLYGDVFQRPDEVGIYNQSNNVGDLMIDSGYDMTRLSTTTNNSVLTVDSTATYGITWKDPSMSLFSSCFATSNSQMFVAISTTADVSVAFIPIRANMFPTLLMVTAALNSSVAATGTIKLKENSTLNTLATVTVNSGTTKITRYVVAISATTQDYFILTAKTSNILVSINVYAVVLI